MTDRATSRPSGASPLSRVKSGLQSLFPQILAIFAAFVVGAVILTATGYDPVAVYSAMLQGAFGDTYGVGQTLTQATPIIFTALSFLFAFKSGLFNIGAEGQLLLGSFAAALVGILFKDLPAAVLVPLAVLAGGAAGALWAFVPAYLKAKVGAHEVITTMMFTYIATNLTGYFVNYPFKAPGWVAQTVLIGPSAELPRILPPTQLSASFILAVGLAAAVYWVLQRTTLGYEVRASGLNPSASENAGISVKRTMVLAFMVSGALAGIGGAGEVLGVHYRFIQGFSPGYGFDGLAVALVGGLNPLGTVLAALLFGALRSGSMQMMRVTHVPSDIVVVLQALVIIFVAAPTLIRLVMKRRRRP